MLVIGNPGWMPWLFNTCPSIASVRKITELAALSRDGETYDRIVIAREAQFTHEMIAWAGALLDPNHGILVAFQADDGWSQKRALEFYYPEARSWELETDAGRALVAEPKGTSWRFYA